MNRGRINPRVSAVILLEKNGDAFFQHRDNKPGLNYPGMWGFPGGHCDEGEDFATCARREFREETDYDCCDLQWLENRQVTISETGISYELATFWEIYDGLRQLACREGQEMRFLERRNASQYAIPDYLIPLWDLAWTRSQSAH